MAPLRVPIGLLAVWLASVAALAGRPPMPAAQRNPETFIFDECPAVGALLEAPDGQERFANPAFRTPAEVDAAVAERRQMLACLESVRFRTVLPDWFPAIRGHLELFLSFAAPPVDARTDALELIDLATVDDPAARRLREDVGLAPPAGFVFVRYFERREEMPEPIRWAFESPQTQAVTLSSRYVAVLSRAGLAGGPAIRRSLEATFSHEMVHAFLNARLDWREGSPRFPSWFHEGMAIHFSRSGRAHVGVDPATGGLIRVGPTGEYERYERVFLYLEDRLGAAFLHQAIRGAVAQVDVSPLLEAAGMAGYDELVEEAELWWRWWPLPPSMVRGRNIWLSGGGVVILIALVVGLWRRWQPAVPGSSLEVTLNEDLIEAVRLGEADAIRYLLKSGADPNAQDAGGWPALLWAVWVGRPDIVDLLVDHGARVTGEVRRFSGWRDDPAIVRIVADAAARQRDVW